MNEESAFEGIRACLKTALDLDEKTAQQITRETNAGDLAAWDSLSHLKLILEMEKFFNVAFDEEEIVELVSVAAILKSLENKKK